MSNTNIEVMFALPKSSTEYYDTLQRLRIASDNSILIQLFTKKYEQLDVSMIGSSKETTSIVLSNLENIFKSDDIATNLSDTIEILLYLDNTGSISKLYEPESESDSSCVIINLQATLDTFEANLRYAISYNFIRVIYNIRDLNKVHNEVNNDKKTNIKDILQKIDKIRDNVKFNIYFDINLYIKFLIDKIKHTHPNKMDIKTFLSSYQLFYNTIRKICVNIDDGKYFKDFCKLSYADLISNYENNINFESSDSMKLYCSRIYFKLIFKQNRLVDVKLLYEHSKYSEIYKLAKLEYDLRIFLNGNNIHEDDNLQYLIENSYMTTHNSIVVNDKELTINSYTPIEDSLLFIENYLKDIFKEIL